MDEVAPRGFRERVLAGEPLLGTFLNLGSAVAAEICGRAGLDWLLLDLEHGSGSSADLMHQLHAIGGTGAAPIVRVEGPTRTHAARALDPGAAGVMFPRIESAADARDAVSFMRYPPDGVRGVAIQNRAADYGRLPMTALVDLDDTLTGVIQVETLGALRELDAIAAVDGVDVLFVGPGDLSYALGVPGDLAAAVFQEAIADVLAACQRHGIAAGILVRTPDDAMRYFRLGYSFLAVGSDSALVAAGADAIVSSVREARSLTA
jgi:2-dehydro-3-deoxyglucarate aldolase/4-hydroxy-2-oxoheptanedioate aldolase